MCGCNFRKFISVDEELERLKQYKDQLQREIAGVDAKIEELKAE
jgi:hypothetical protein